MIKLVFCLRRREELDLDEFQRYWRDTHAEEHEVIATVTGGGTLDAETVWDEP